MTLALVLATAPLGCKAPELPTSTADVLPSQGIVLGLRDATGEPDLGGRAALGGGDLASPDASGFVYYVNVPPGRTPVRYVYDDVASAYGSPEVFPDALSAASFVPLGLDTVVVDDLDAPLSITGDGFTAEVPGGAWVRDGALAAGPIHVGWRTISDADRPGVPSDGMGIASDDEVHPIVLDQILVTRAWNDEGDVLVDNLDGTDVDVTYVVDLPVGSPLLEPGLEVRVYVYGFVRTYWQYTTRPEIDATARTATFDAPGFGWIGLGRLAPPRSCVSGKLVDGSGAGISGAEVRLFDPGVMSAERASARDGTFCLPVTPGATTTLDALGVDPHRLTLYTAHQTVTGGDVATCGNGCVDLGSIRADAWPDSDGDHAWAGPGGDCDDNDPDVNPNPALGDGSYCGEPL